MRLRVGDHFGVRIARLLEGSCWCLDQLFQLLDGLGAQDQSAVGGAVAAHLLALIDQCHRGKHWLVFRHGASGLSCPGVEVVGGLEIAVGSSHLLIAKTLLHLSKIPLGIAPAAVWIAGRIDDVETIVRARSRKHLLKAQADEGVVASAGGGVGDALVNKWSADAITLQGLRVQIEHGQ